MKRHQDFLQFDQNHLRRLFGHQCLFCYEFKLQIKLLGHLFWPSDYSKNVCKLFQMIYLSTFQQKGKQFCHTKCDKVTFLMVFKSTSRQCLACWHEHKNNYLLMWQLLSLSRNVKRLMTISSVCFTFFDCIVVSTKKEMNSIFHFSDTKKKKTEWTLDIEKCNTLKKNRFLQIPINSSPE